MASDHSPQSDIPISVLTGFLGSGKTTLVNVILREEHGRRVGVIVNEFGQVDIDGRLIQAAREDVVELPNGCLCCRARGNLPAALDRLLARQPPPEYILVEASGIAEPIALAQSLLQPDLDPRLVLDGLVCVADALFLDRNLSERQEAREQLAAADLIVLNKLDLVDQGARERAERLVRDHNPMARIIPASFGQVPVRELLNLRALATVDHARLLQPLAARPAPHADLTTVALVEPRPLDLDRFNRWLAQVIPLLGRRLLRAKGIVALAGWEERWVFQAVRDMVGVVPDRSWQPGEPRDSRLVFIGHELDQQTLQRGLSACATDPA